MSQIIDEIFKNNFGINIQGKVSRTLLLLRQPSINYMPYMENINKHLVFNV